MSETIEIKADNTDEGALLVAVSYMKSNPNIARLVCGALTDAGIEYLGTPKVSKKQSGFFFTAFHLGLATGIRDLMSGKLNIVLTQTESGSGAEEEGGSE